MAKRKLYMYSQNVLQWGGGGRGRSTVPIQVDILLKGTTKIVLSLIHAHLF